MKKSLPNTWPVHAILFVVFGGIFWAIFIRAIDTGSLLQWALASIILMIAIMELIRTALVLIKR